MNAISLHSVGAHALGTVLLASGILKLFPSRQDTYVFRIKGLTAKVPRKFASLLESAVGVGVFLERTPWLLLPVAAVLIVGFFISQASIDGPCACFGPLSSGTESKKAKFVRLVAMVIALTAASTVVVSPTRSDTSLPGILMGLTLGVLIIGIGELNLG